MRVVIALIILSWVACATAQLSSITLYVSNSTDSTDNANCSSSAPCASIAWAIQVACNQTLPAEITVSPGIYSMGNVTIEDICPPINIRSSGGSNVTAIVQKNIGDDHILRCYGSEITIEGFTCTDIHVSQPFYFDGCDNVTLKDMQFENCSGEYLVRSFTVQNTTLAQLGVRNCQAEFEVLGVVGGQATLEESVWERVSARQLIVIARWDDVTVRSLTFRSVNATDLLELSGNTFGSQATLSHIQLEGITSTIQLSGHAFDLNNITLVAPMLPPEQTIFQATCDSLDVSGLVYREGTGGLLSVKPFVSQIDHFSLFDVQLVDVSSSTRSIIELHNVDVMVMSNVMVNETSTPTLVELTQSWLDTNASTTLLVEKLTVTQSSWNQLVRSTGSQLSIKARDVSIESNTNYMITELDCAFSLGSEQSKPLEASFTNLTYRSNQQPLLNAEYARDVTFTESVWEDNQASLIRLTNGMVNLHTVQVISNQVPLLPLLELGTMSGSFVNVNVSSNQCKDCLLWETSSSFVVNNTLVSGNSVSDGSLLLLLDSQISMSAFSAQSNNLQSSTVVRARGSSSLSLSDVHFQENQGNMEGAIYCDGEASLFVDNSTFLSNREAVLAMWGYSTVLLNTSLFQENTGGAILVNEGASVHIEATRFIDNQGVLGGAVALLGDSNSSFIQSCDFINCTSEIAGGAIYVTGYSQFTLSNSTIQACEALGGSVTVAQYARPYINQCNFINNTGSALVLNDRSYADVHDTKFIGNSVPSSGGAIIITASSELHAENCEFDGNSCGSQGGGVAVINQGKAKLISCSAHGHEARAAGFLYATDSTQVEIQDCEIRENTAQSSGGALYCSGSASIIMNSTHIEYNNALSNAGGGIYSQGAANITISHSMISNNMALQGGGLYSSSKVGMEVLNCTVSGNKADSTGGGGGMHLGGTGAHHWSQSIFSNNEATRADGGAIYMELAVMMNLVNCSFSLNHGRKGGAIYLEDNAAVQASLTQFEWNEANLGGAVFVGLGADCQMNTTTWLANRATSHGGGLYVEGDMAISDCHFQDNIAFYSGGAISLLSLTPSLADSTFQGNSALKGGALSLDSQDHSIWNRGPEFHGLDMTENRASLGGAIYVLLLGQSTPSFHSSTTFTGNLALLGGGVFVDSFDSNHTLLYDALFTNNTVLYGGSTLGFGELDEEQEAWVLNPEGLCVNCSFELRGDQSGIYENEQGFASIPRSLDFPPGFYVCHRAMPVDSGTLQFQVVLYDAFHTPVTGRILEDESMSIRMTLESSNATVTADSHSQALSNDTGSVVFTGIQVCGPSGSVVSVRFDCEDCNIFNGSQYQVQPLDDCSFLWQGCTNSGDVPAILPPDDDETDAVCAVCVKQNNYVVEVFGLLMMLVLALFICLVGIVGTLCWTRYKRRRIRKLYESIEIPDFSSSSLSFHSLLVDASIPRLAWDEMEVNMGDVIGHGASGLVIQGLYHSSRGSRTVALKQLILGMEDLEADSLNEFLREIKLMNALRHEHIVDFIGICLPPDESCLFLVEELMERGSIHDILAKKRENVTIDLRFRFAIGAAKGLAHLHSKKLIHRDIKTDNLLVDKAWDCKIADFGISTVRPSITRNMTCVGTPTFMAPEVLSNEKYSEKADVYSFGIVLYELFSGKRPFSTGRFKQMNLAVLNGAIVAGARPPIDQFPFPLQALIRDCWNENPDLRPHCEEITTRLERLAAEGFDELSELSETETETETE